jgi:hypothetical protein
MKYSSRVGVAGADDFGIGENVETRKAGAGEREDDQGSGEFHCGGVYVLSVFLFFFKWETKSMYSEQGRSGRHRRRLYAYLYTPAWQRLGSGPGDTKTLAWPQAPCRGAVMFAKKRMSPIRIASDSWPVHLARSKPARYGW